jgi:hypothetical protein
MSVSSRPSSNTCAIRRTRRGFAKRFQRPGSACAPRSATNSPSIARWGLDDPSLSDDALLDAMVAHPILINRPFVFTPMGARLCRPDSSLVLDILPPCDRPFTKEDGEVVIDADGKRVP